METELQNFIAARQAVEEMENQGPMSILSRRYAAYAQAHFELRRAERILAKAIERLESHSQMPPSGDIPNEHHARSN